MAYSLYGLNRFDKIDNHRFGVSGVISCRQLLKSFESRKDAEDYVKDSTLTNRLRYPSHGFDPFISNIYYKEDSLLHCFEDYEIRDSNDKIVATDDRIKHKSYVIEFQIIEGRQDWHLKELSNTSNVQNKLKVSNDRDTQDELNIFRSSFENFGKSYLALCDSCEKIVTRLNKLEYDMKSSRTILEDLLASHNKE